jgi:hypothetical protein
MLIAASFIVTMNSAVVPVQDEITIWKEFVQLLKTDALTPDRVRPADPLTPASQLILLKDFAKNATWEEWEAAPEVVRNENLVTFFVTLGQKSNSPWTYTFNFVVEDGRWYYRFLEGIVLRLDKVTSLPAAAADFPDLSEENKVWVWQEAYWSQMVRLYNQLAGLKGRDYALSSFRDGVGYALAGSVWIPFYATPRAFILYLCWEQGKLQGNKVTLEKLTEREAVVRFDDSIYFALYVRTSHLKNQIAFEDYAKIFETIWQDRARAAGWTLKIDGQGRKIYLRFSR